MIMESLKVTHRPLTVDDYNHLPEGGPQYQLIEGEMHMTPAPNRYHQTISGKIEFILRRYLEENPIGIIYDAPFDVVFTDVNVFQPDIIYVANEHRSILTDQGASGAPDLIVEILSPKTTKLDVGVKKTIYARTGVQELWIVDPEAKRLAVYRLQENSETPAQTLQPGQTLSTPLLPGLDVDLESVFQMD